MLNQGVDSWHPVGSTFLGMRTQSLALLPALMGTKSVTDCILLLVPLLCPPAPLVRMSRGLGVSQGAGGDRHMLGRVAKGLL